MKLRKSRGVSLIAIKFIIRVCLVIFVSQQFNSNVGATRLCQNVLPTIESVVGEVTGAFNVSFSDGFMNSRKIHIRKQFLAFFIESQFLSV